MAEGEGHGTTPHTYDEINSRFMTLVSSMFPDARRIQLRDGRRRGFGMTFVFYVAKVQTGRIRQELAEMGLKVERSRYDDYTNKYITTGKIDVDALMKLK